MGQQDKEERRGKLLIDIPEHIYEHAKEMTEDSRDEGEAMRAIANGSPARGEGMKRVFTICVPDDCYLKVANIVAVVEKKDHSTNGVTIFTSDSVGDEEQEWIFTTNDKAKKMGENE